MAKKNDFGSLLWIILVILAVIVFGRILNWW